MERAGEPRRTLAGTTSGAPMLFQGFPHRPPVLRGRLHDDLLNVLLDQPVGEAAQTSRRGPDLLAVEVKLAVVPDVGHRDRQHLLVDVNSRDPVRRGSLLRERRACLVASVRVASYREALRSPHDAQLFTQSRTLRTTPLLGLNSATGWFDLAAPDPIVTRVDFHRPSRA